MKLRAILPVLMLSCSLCASAQRNKPEPKILILPVVDLTTDPRSNTTVNSTLARAKLLVDIGQKAIESVSPALAQATADVEKLDLTDPANWTKEHFKTLAREAGVQFVSGIVIRKVVDSDEPIASEATVSGWLYEVRFDRFLFENKESTFKFVPKPAPEATNTPGQHHYSAIGGAVTDLFKGFLKEIPKKAKKKKPEIIPSGPERIK